MRISQMTCDQAADALVRISYAASPILKDGTVRKAIGTVADHRGDKDLLATLGDIVDAVIPTLLKDHRDNTYEICGALLGVSRQEVAERNILQTIREVKDSFDQELSDFFHSLKG